MAAENPYTPAASIASAALGCRIAFLDCAGVPELMKGEWAENRLAEFNLWASGVGAFAKKRASLDERLSADEETRGILVNLLSTLQRFVEQCKDYALQPASSDEEDKDPEESQTSFSLSTSQENLFSTWDGASLSDTDSEGGPQEPNLALKEAMKSSEAILEQLIRLAVAIRKSGTTSRLQKADRRFEPNDYREFRNHLVLVILADQKLSDLETPICDPSRSATTIQSSLDAMFESLDPTQKRLIEANLRRRNRFTYARRHADKLGRWNEMPRIPYQHSVQEYKIQSHKPKPEESVSQVTDTTASKAATQLAISDLLTSTPSQATMSQISMTAARMVYPRPPRVKDGLKNFKCPCCYQSLPAMYLERRHWRKHVTNDLCPYTCPFKQCPKPNQLYSTRQMWISHVQNDHGSQKYWECHFCRPSKQFHTRPDFVSHCQGAHSDTITAEQIHLLAESPSNSSYSDLRDCPLCPWADKNKETDPAAILDHVVEHIHAFSLRSLPWGSAADDKRATVRALDKVLEWKIERPESVVEPLLDQEGWTESGIAWYQQETKKIDEMHTRWRLPEDTLLTDPLQGIWGPQEYFAESDKSASDALMNESVSDPSSQGTFSSQEGGWEEESEWHRHNAGGLRRDSTSLMKKQGTSPAQEPGYTVNMNTEDGNLLADSTSLVSLGALETEDVDESIELHRTRRNADSSSERPVWVEEDGWYSDTADRIRHGRPRKRISDAETLKKVEPEALNFDIDLVEETVHKKLQRLVKMEAKETTTRDIQREIEKYSRLWERIKEEKAKRRYKEEQGATSQPEHAEFQDEDAPKLDSHASSADLGSPVTSSKAKLLTGDRPTYIKMSLEHISTQTLAYYDLPWEYDQNDKHYIIILREMDPQETEVLFEHTRRLRTRTTLPIEDRAYAWVRRRKSGDLGPESRRRTSPRRKAEIKEFFF